MVNSGEHMKAAGGWCRSHKESLFATFVILLVIAIIGAYCTYSTLSWGRIQTDAMQAQGDIHRQVKDTITAQKLGVEQLTALHDTTSRRIESLCQAPSAIAWQTGLVSQFKDQRDRCQQAKSALQKVPASIAVVTSRLNNEKTISSFLSQAKKQLDAATQNDYAKMQTIWHEAEMKVAALHTDASLQDTQTQVISAIKEIEAALQKLAEADKAQKRPDFDAAASEVEKAYGKLAGTQNTATESFGKLIKALDESIK